MTATPRYGDGETGEVVLTPGQQMRRQELEAEIAAAKEKLAHLIQKKKDLKEQMERTRKTLSEMEGEFHENAKARREQDRLIRAAVAALKNV